MANQGNGPVVHQRAQTEPAPLQHDHRWETLYAGRLPAAISRRFPRALNPSLLRKRPHIQIFRLMRMNEMLPPLAAAETHVGPYRDGRQRRSVQHRRSALFRQGAEPVTAHKGDLSPAQFLRGGIAATQRKASLRLPAFRQDAAAQASRDQMGTRFSGAFPGFFQPAGQRWGKGRREPGGFLRSLHPQIGRHLRCKGRLLPLRHQHSLRKRLRKPLLHPIAQ